MASDTKTTSPEKDASIKTKLKEYEKNIEHNESDKSLNDSSVSNTGYVRWYPHREVSNRPNIKGTEEFKAGTKSDKRYPNNDLENYGAYHFQVYIFSEYEKSPLTKSIKNNETADKIKGNKEDADKFGDALTQKLGIENEIMTKLISAGTTTYAYGATIFEVGYQFFKNGIDVFNTSTDGTMEAITPAPSLSYANHSSIKCDIYLPLTNYETKRNSGIAQSEDVISSTSTILNKAVVEKGLELGGGILNASLNKRGQSIRKFIAPRIGAPNLETLSLKWELTPRNTKEMEHITDILRFFQSVSVANFDKDDLFYQMPPALFMEAISKDHTRNKSVKLKPKRQYYITSISVEYSVDNGQVILTPDGYPMFITLNIDLMKATLTSFKELFVYPFM